MTHIHFNQVLVFSPITHTQMTWADPGDRQGADFTTPGYWQGLARTLERGRFDGVFFADTLALPADSQASAADTMTFGSYFPRLDPFALIPYMASVTEHLGFGVTLSTAGTPPFLAVRRLGTLDNLTGGRVAWNVVTSHVRNDFEALGLTQPDHDTRYDQAEDYMEICYRLWDAFPRDALVVDRENGVYIDPARVGKVDFDGKYLKCHAYPVVMNSLQGRPLIFQAGQSGRGLSFAATHADAIYGLQPRVGAMAKFVEAADAAGQAAGKADRPKVFFGLQPIIGGTEAEARAKRSALAERVPLKTALSRFGAMIGADLDNRDLDQPLADVTTNASQGILSAMLDVFEGRVPSIREAALHWGTSYGMPQLVGTPELVATQIETFWRESRCYGFNISPTVNPTSIEDFVDGVVPILQKRGLMRSDYEGKTFRDHLYA